MPSSPSSDPPTSAPRPDPALGEATGGARRADANARNGSHRWTWLRSQGLGVACGLATVFLLAVGSFVLSATADGASAGIALDDIRPFFTRPSVFHAWFYLLVPVLGLYALNTILATWHSVTRKLRAGIRSPASYGPAVIHVAFLLALVAHGVGGLFGSERGQVLLNPDWTRLPDGREARLVSARLEHLPGGMPKEARVEVEVRERGGKPQRSTIGFNQPLSSGLGSDLYLYAGQRRRLWARLSLGKERCLVAQGQRCTLGPHTFLVLRLLRGGHWGWVPAARLHRVHGPGEAWTRWVVGGSGLEVEGARLRIDGLEERPVVALRARHAPGNPWALGAALVLLLGIGMMWRRLVSRQTEREGGPSA